jgi:hypothetical protein
MVPSQREGTGQPYGEAEKGATSGYWYLKKYRSPYTKVAIRIETSSS